MKKKAFIVGIDSYPVPNTLQGCVDDAKDMVNTLVICGFDPRHMKVCTNSRATKNNILGGIDWLLNGADKGDSLVFYYSGHGSHVVDLDGDEPDQQDEILCPVDINFENKIYILDDDLRNRFTKLPEGATLEIISDSCFSGTITKVLLPTDSTMPSRLVKYLPPPYEYTFQKEYIPELKKNKLLKKNGSNDVDIDANINHIVWTGCLEHQVSEIDVIEGVHRSVFTYNFCQVLRRTNGDIPRKKLHGIVNAALKRGRYEQVPGLEVKSNSVTATRPFQ